MSDTAGFREVAAGWRGNLGEEAIRLVHATGWQARDWIGQRLGRQVQGPVDRGGELEVSLMADACSLRPLVARADPVGLQVHIGVIAQRRAVKWGPVRVRGALHADLELGLGENSSPGGRR